LGRFLRRHWTSSFEGLSRRDRRGCDYDAHVPDALAGWELSLFADLAAHLGDAEQAVRALNSSGTRHVSLEGLARFLLHRSSVTQRKAASISGSTR
jgi:hypothetical protein